MRLCLLILFLSLGASPASAAAITNPTDTAQSFSTWDGRSSVTVTALEVKKNAENLAKESERITTEFSAAMRRISDSSSEMLRGCNELSSQSAHMNLEVDKFLSGLEKTG